MAAMFVRQRLILLFSLSLILFCLWGRIIGFIVELPLDASRIYHLSGHAYGYVLEAPPCTFFVADDERHLTQSRAEFYEDDRQLNPPHEVHKAIVDSGGGRWSHWQTTVIFSALDNSDPSTGGHAYKVRLPAYFGWPLLLCLVAAALALVIPPGISGRSVPPLTQQASAGINYRPDIDGLRGIAILLVITFHYFPNVINGGFVGVDVFFVISGYLISSIIIGDITRGSFSFVGFYRRRILRIFPALAVVLAASGLIGLVLLLPDDYAGLGKHIAGGAGFVSNIVLWNESGYFDVGAGIKPLLNLWSLGVEEQFYLIHPLLLWVAWRARLNTIAVIIVITLFSLTFNLTLYTRDPVADFYSPLTRLWELMVGGLAAAIRVYGQQQRQQIWSKLAKTGPAHEIASATGLILILMAGYVITDNDLFPGLWALVPTLGTVLMISAGRHTLINRTILSHPVAVWIGLISFPLYLWHWPLLVFLRLSGDTYPSSLARAALLLVSFVLAWLTYRVIERPLRFGPRGGLKAMALLIAMIALGWTGYYINSEGGLPSLYDEAGRKLVKRILNVGKENAYVWAEKRKVDLAYFDNDNKIRVLVIGDSFSGDLINSLRQSEYDAAIQIRSLTIGTGCGNLMVASDLSAFIPPKKQVTCRDDKSYKNPRFIQMIKEADVIMLSSFWTEWEPIYLAESIRNLSAIPKASILVVGTKALSAGKATWKQLLRLPETTRYGATYKVPQSVNDLNDRLRAAAGSQRFIDIEKLLCGPEQDCPIFDQNRWPLSLDGLHLTVAGAQFLGVGLGNDPVLRAALARMPGGPGGP